MTISRRTATKSEGKEETKPKALPSLSEDTVVAFESFLDALAEDTLIGNSVIRGAAHELNIEALSLSEIGAAAVNRIRSRRENKRKFGAHVSDYVHEAFRDVAKNVMTFSELLGRVSRKGDIHAREEHEYRDVLEKALKNQPNSFRVEPLVEGVELVYRNQDESGNPTNVQVLAIPESPSSAPAKRRGRPAKAKTASAPAAKKKAASKGKGGKTKAPRDPNAPAKGPYVNVIKKALKLTELTGKQQSSLVQYMNGVKLNAATPAQIKAAAEAAGIL